MAEEKTIENFLTTVESNLATTLAAKAAALPMVFRRQNSNRIVLQCLKE